MNPYCGQTSNTTDLPRTRKFPLILQVYTNSTLQNRTTYLQEVFISHTTSLAIQNEQMLKFSLHLCTMLQKWQPLKRAIKSTSMT